MAINIKKEIDHLCTLYTYYMAYTYSKSDFTLPPLPFNPGINFFGMPLNLQSYFLCRSLNIF